MSGSEILKKIFCVLLTLCLIAGTIVGCTNGGSGDDDNSTPSNPQPGDGQALLSCGVVKNDRLVNPVSESDGEVVYLGIVGSLAVGLIIFLSSIKSLREGLSEKVKSHQDFLSDLTLQVEAFNHTVFILHLLPLLACRIIVLITALLIPLAVNFEPFFLLYTCFGCVMISIMQPEEKFFMILCPRCGIKTSRFLADQKQCLACLKGK